MVESSYCENGIYSFLGLAMKAGKLLSGEETCERAVKTKKVYLTIVAEDASQNTKKKFTDICSYRGVNINIFGKKELIGRYIGKEIRSVIVILDEGFAQRLIKMISGLVLESGGGFIGQNQSI